MKKSTFRVRVRAVRYEARDIYSYELVRPDGSALPHAPAGSHVSVHMPNGLVRQYSLCGDPLDERVYRIGVLHNRHGRGGSRAMHEEIRPGQIMEISAPRNAFPLSQVAKRHLLLAGGIGVTPLLAMVHEIRRRGEQFVLHYCARTREDTAFVDELSAAREGGRVVLHHDEGDPRRGLDIPKLLEHWELGTHMYCCGPLGFMTAAKKAAAHWPPGTVHFEYFEASQGSTGRREGSAFQVKIASTGALYDVPEHQTIVDVLRSHKMKIETSCEEGYCAACLTEYLEGEPEHRDSILTKQERMKYVLVCCSRSRTPILVLDL